MFRAMVGVPVAACLILLTACVSTPLQDRLSVTKSGLNYRVSEFGSLINTDSPPTKAGDALVIATWHFKKAKECQCEEEILETEKWMKEYDKRLKEWKNK